jgi:hypothetical protein
LKNLKALVVFIKGRGKNQLRTGGFTGGCLIIFKEKH